MTKILIIEDESIIRENLKELLEIYDYDVIQAEDGEVGLQKVYKDEPDIILCDINMPKLNGFEVLKKLQSDPHTFTIPFLFLTAFSDRDKFREGMSLGADDYITKPYQKDDVLKAIETRLTKTKNISIKNNARIEDLRKSVSMSIPHELRTPLNSILGFSQLLKEYHKDLSEDDMISMFNNIYDSGQRLLRIIDNYSFYTNVLTSDKNQISSNESEYNIKNLLEIDISEINEKYEDIEIISISDNYNTKLKNQFVSKIIYEAIDNACKFSKKDSKVEIIGKLHNNRFYLTFKNEMLNDQNIVKEEIGAFVQIYHD
jgi:CheY-like chemotaxis protein